MHVHADAVQRPTFTGTPLQVVLHDLAAVVAKAHMLDSRSRTAFASIAEHMLLSRFAGELAVLEAERWLSEAHS